MDKNSSHSLRSIEVLAEGERNLEWIGEEGNEEYVSYTLR